MKIGYFETWNKEAQMIEKSSSRLQQFVTLILTFGLILLWIRTKTDLPLEFIILVLILLVAAFIPKSLKEFTSLKEKISKV